MLWLTRYKSQSQLLPARKWQITVTVAASSQMTNHSHSCCQLANDKKQICLCLIGQLNIEIFRWGQKESPSKCKKVNLKDFIQFILSYECLVFVHASKVSFLSRGKNWFFLGIKYFYIYLNILINITYLEIYWYFIEKRIIALSFKTICGLIREFC